MSTKSDTTVKPSVFAKLQSTAFSVLDAVDHSAKAVAETAWAAEELARAARIKAAAFAKEIEDEA